MKYLVVVDMQNDFIDGALGTQEAQAVVPKVVKKIEEFDGTVMWTQDTHDSNYLSTQEGQLLPVEHCIGGSNGWKLHPSVEEAIIRKEGKFTSHGPFLKCTFGSYDLGDTLQDEYCRHTCGAHWDGVDEIVLVGLCTDICVISNALLLKTFLPKVKIVVDASCCAGVTPERHKTALEAMKACQIFIENEVTE